MLYPWHTETWRLIQRTHASGRLPHALLFSGSEGCGHEALIKTLVASLLCNQPTAAGYACGICRSCQLEQGNTHPDQLWIQPAEDKQNIAVDAVRELIRFLTLSTSYSKHRVVVIQPAESLNQNAANSLLKALEEPTAHTHLILWSYQPSKLMPTIRSRCQHLRLGLPHHYQALEWLRLQNLQHEPSTLLSQALGKPLYAASLDTGNQLTLRQEFFQQWVNVLQGQGSLSAFSAKWQKNSRSEWLAWLYMALHTQLKQRYQTMQQPSDHDALQQWLQQRPLEVVWQLLQHWQSLKLMEMHPLNNQIFIETIVARWLMIK